jgi:hypothetical protein
MADDEADLGTLLRWLSSFPSVTGACAAAGDLADGVVLLEAFSEVDRTVDIDSIKRNIGSTWPLAAKNFRMLALHLETFYADELRESADLSFADADAIAKGQSPDGVIELARLMLGCVIKCTDNQAFIARILELEADDQEQLQEILKDVMDRFEKTDDGTPRSPRPVQETPSPRRALEPEREPDEFGVGTELMQDQMDTIERLTTENAQHEHKHRELEKWIADMQAKNEQLSQEAASRRSTVDDGEWKIKQLEFDRDEKQGKIEELERSLDRKEESIKKSRDEMDILRSKAKKVDRAERARLDYEKQMEVRPYFTLALLIAVQPRPYCNPVPVYTARQDMRTKVAANARMKVGYDALEQERDTLLQEKERIQAQASSLRAEADKLTRQRNALEQQIASAGTSRGDDSDELRQQFMQQSLELEQVRAQLDAATAARESGDVYGESLGGAFGDEFAPPAIEVLTGPTKAKLARCDVVSLSWSRLAAVS